MSYDHVTKIAPEAAYLTMVIEVRECTYNSTKNTATRKKKGKTNICDDNKL